MLPPFTFSFARSALPILLLDTPMQPVIQGAPQATIPERVSQSQQRQTLM
jgi:hypothetical protein